MPVARWMRRAVPRVAVATGSLALVLTTLGAAPVARAEDGLSTGDTVVGTLTRAWSEQKDPVAEAKRGEDALLTFVHTADGQAVRVATPQAEHLPEGATVAVTVGKQVSDAASRQDGLDPARQVLAADVVAAAPAPTPAAATTAPAATPPLTDQVTVVMVVPAGATQDATTLQQVVDQVNGPVADFWQAQSNGTIRLGVSGQYDWFHATVDCSNPYALWNQAATYANNWTSGTGQHLMLYLPKGTPGCAYGLAEVGRSLTSGGRLYVTDTITSVIAHELGHNFGLGHSSEIQCDATVDTGTCRTTAYRDYYDVMAASWDQLGSLTVGQAARIGLLPAAEQQTLTWPASSTGITLTPVSSRGGLRALKLVDPDGTVYWLEYRPAAGQDAWLGTAADWPGLDAGVLLREDGAIGASDTSLLLDGTPSPSSYWSSDIQTALPIARGVSFDYGMFTVTLDSTSPTAAVVRVTSGPSLRSWTPGGNHLPWANWEAATASGTTLTVGGWAFDPDSPAWSGQVHVYVDGVGVPLRADVSRPDIAAAFPVAGAAHGWGYSTTLAPGIHSVCVYAIDDELPSAHTFLGCRQVPVAVTRPWGNLEEVSVADMTLTVGGWAFDPDSPASPVAVHVYVDGRGTALSADGSRADVGAAFPQAGAAHGFNWSTALSPGVHTVCVYAIDHEFPSTNTPFGCRQLAAGLTRPLANWEALSASGSTLSVYGWAFDPDSPSGPSAVHVYVDGVGTPLLADGSRPDVAAFFPTAGPGHGFGWSTTVPSGRHTVCVYAIDAQLPSVNTPLGCRSITV